MRKKNSISLGPGAASLILIFVALAMAALGMLSLMTARNDLKLSARSAEVTEAVYRLYAEAEERRAELDSLLVSAARGSGDEADFYARVGEGLPEDMALDDDLIVWTQTDGTRNLACALRVQPPYNGARAVWVRHSLTAEISEGMEDFEDEWNW